MLPFGMEPLGTVPFGGVSGGPQLMKHGMTICSRPRYWSSTSTPAAMIATMGQQMIIAHLQLRQPPVPGARQRT